MIANKKYFGASLLLSAIVIFLDQLSKWWALSVTMNPGFDYGTELEITSFFNVVMVWNHGISFGMLSGHRVPILLIVLAVVVVLILLKWLTKVIDRLTSLGIGLVVGGALGNVIDRVRFGAVADFLDFHWENLHWPAFNVADSAIFMGVVVLCIESMMRPPKK